ncbi:MAG: LPS-assembly protein LptD [Bacteroidales bacterium]|nr:LPS-assembly protein LptD [Bacteroidales bacterium]
MLHGQTINDPDSLLIVSDTLQSDTIARGRSANALDARVDYLSSDSIRFDITTQKVYLYRNNDINYKNINLKAGYVEIDFTTSIVSATYQEDTSGNQTGRPVFTEGSNSFESHRMRYNYRTRKGLVQTVVTQDGEGYIHGSKVKYMPNQEVNVFRGSYTTCDHDPPHFEFRYNRAKLIPDNKIVTGPAYLTIEGVPTPFFIPFGMFPNKKGQRSGIVVPTFGESASRGFYLENGGYYQVINNYMDLKVTGDIYSLGSWALKPQVRYNKRYRFNGAFNFSYAENLLGERGSPEYNRYKDFQLRWVHNQDPKARPLSKFSANVNVVSSQYNKFNPVSSNAYLSNTFQSSINYSTSWQGKYFLTAALNHQQNTITREVNLILPKITFSVNRFYPLRKKQLVGKPRWYENISVNYNNQAENRINTYDTLIFKEDVRKMMRNGLQHNLTLSSGSVKLLRYLVWTNNINYTERWYTRTIRKYWSNDSILTGNGWEYGSLMTDTVDGFAAARDYNFSSNISTSLYGVFTYSRGPVRAVRHVIKPSLSFSFRPDFSQPRFGYYRYYTDQSGNAAIYSIFEGSIYGSPPERKSGNIGFRLSNNLEMKIRSKKDTVSGLRKIILIEDLSLAVSYDLAKDSLNFSPLNISGRTTLFKNLQVYYSSSWDPYALNEEGQRINRFEWDVNRKLFRQERHNWRLGLSFRLSSDLIKGERASTAGTEEELREVNENPENYVDWSVPWTLNISYDFNHTTTFRYQNGYRNYDISREKSLVQTISFRGDANVTPKWKIGFTSGYDFTEKKFTYTSIDVYRDLHCWEMRFNWVPLGFRQQWGFTINIKSSLLQDLKLDKKKDFRDF